jgi:quercetin dioxygenase-like cupin family protein
MTRTTKSLAVLAVLTSAVAIADAPAKPPSPEQALVALLKDAKWVAPTAPGIPAGVMVSPVAVDPQTGASIGYAKFPPGYVFPSHWHSQTEYSTVISGKPRFTVEGKTYDLTAGSYIVIPAKAHHSLSCPADAECVVLTRRAGPTDYNWDK